MFNNIFNHLDKLSKGLDASWVRNEVLANNIANIDTPGFKRSDVTFSQILEEESLILKTTREKHMNNIGVSAGSTGEITVYEDSSTQIRMDGNNVDIEHEMNELAKNTILYNYISQIVSKEIKRLDMAINGG